MTSEPRRGDQGNPRKPSKATSKRAVRKRSRPVDSSKKQTTSDQGDTQPVAERSRKKHPITYGSKKSADAANPQERSAVPDRRLRRGRKIVSDSEEILESDTHQNDAEEVAEGQDLGTLAKSSSQRRDTATKAKPKHASNRTDDSVPVTTRTRSKNVIGNGRDDLNVEDEEEERSPGTDDRALENDEGPDSAEESLEAGQGNIVEDSDDGFFGDNSGMDDDDQLVYRLLSKKCKLDLWSDMCQNRDKHRKTLKAHGLMSSGNRPKFGTRIFHDKFAPACDSLVAFYNDIDAGTGAMPKLRTFMSSLDAITFDSQTPRAEKLALDFYGTGIYRLVEVLKTALLARAEDIARTNATQAVAEIIALIGPLIRTGERVRASKVKPLIKAPIISFTTRCLPMFRQIKERLERIQESERQDESVAALVKFQEAAKKRRAFEIELEIEKRDREIRRRHQRMRHEMMERYGPPAQARLNSSKSQRKSFEWTEQRKFLLLSCLSQLDHLPLETRFDRILHMEEFQNLSREMIREQALELKTTAIGLIEGRGGEIPNWVDSIR